MPSKYLCRWALVPIFILNSSCGLKWGEDAPEDKAPVFSASGYQCVGAIAEHIRKYTRDELNESQINDFMFCMQRAFTSFAQLTRGRSENVYTPDEIRRFLQTYFIKDAKISDQLLSEFMILKRAFIGGNENTITREELHQAIGVLDELRREALRLKPHIKYLNPTMAREQDIQGIGKNLNLAYEALQASIRVIGKRLHDGNRPYPLDNLHVFISEWRGFVKWEEHIQNSISVDKWVEFLRVFKELTVSPQDTGVIRTTDWIPLMEALSRWYLAYLQYEVGVRGKPLLYGVGLQNLMHLVREISSLVEQGVSRQPNLTITFDQLSSLVNALYGVKWIPKSWRQVSLDSAVKALVGRVFGDPGIPVNERGSQGLSLGTVNRLMEVFYQWAYVQVNLDRQYRDSNLRVMNEPEVPNLQPQLAIALEALIGPSEEVNDPDWKEFLKVRSKLRPLFADGSHMVTVAPFASLPKDVHHGFHNLSIMNILRSITGLIFRGYAVDGSGRIAWDAGLSGPEMESFYSDFREIGIDIGFVDKRNVKTGSRVFIEGNLFTYSADGLIPNATDLRGKMTFTETMELFAFLYSGGNMAGKMYDKLRDQHRCREGEPDQKGVPRLERGCVELNMADTLEDLLNTMPELKQFVAISSEDVRAHFVGNLLDMAYSPAHSHTEWIELSEFSTVAVVLHYAEAIMTRYDVSPHDGMLTNPELETAVPIFRGFFQKFIKDTEKSDLSDSDARGAFYYIILNEKLPGNFWEKLTAWRMGAIFTDGVSMNRLKLSNVFKVIISKLVEGKDSDAAPTAEVHEHAPCQPNSTHPLCRRPGTVK